MIGAIMGWAELGCEESPPGTKIRDRFHKIRDQSHRAAKLTAQLLAFGRKQVLQPRKVNLNHFGVVEEMGFLGKVIGENIVVEIVSARDLQITNVDPTQLQQVFMNLLLKRTRCDALGGKLIIKTSNAQIDEEFCRKHVYAAHGNYVARV